MRPPMSSQVTTITGEQASIRRVIVTHGKRNRADSPETHFRLERIDATCESIEDKRGRGDERKGDK